MQCNNFSTLEGCGRCTYSITDFRNISMLDSVSIIDILDKIVDICNESLIYRLLLYKTSITCTGNIVAVYSNIKSSNITKYAVDIYCIILRTWLKYNIELIYESINIVYLILCIALLDYKENYQIAAKYVDSLEYILKYIFNYIKKLKR